MLLHGLLLLSLLLLFLSLLKALMARQSHSEEADSDPLVWTNERVMKWCHSIDLGVGLALTHSQFQSRNVPKMFFFFFFSKLLFL